MMLGGLLWSSFRVYDSLQEFHAFFAASFGRKQWRDHSGNYLQALLVQEERRNAENLSESVGISARAMQRFLTEARWSETVIGRLQEYFGTPGGGVGVRGSDLEIGGSGPAVLRTRWPTAMGCSWPKPAGPGVGGQAAVSAQELDLRPGPVCCGGCAGGPAELPVKDGVGPGDAGAGPGCYLGPPDDAFGMSPTFREGLAARCATCTFRAALRSGPCWPNPGFGRPRKPKLRPGQRRTMEQPLPDEAWREITVAQGSQGPRTYRFSAQRVRATRRRKPGEDCGPSGAGTWTAASPAYLPNAPEGTTLETLAYVGGSWRKRSWTEKGDVGLDELGRVASPHSHVPAGWSVPAEPSRIGGKKMPRSLMLPRE